MAVLPKTPWTNMQDTRVATDAPVSTDLMTDLSVNENYLKAVLTDGAAAPQAIVTKGVTANGNLVVTGTGNITGTLSAGPLTITSGGANITGNSTVTGDLAVTNNFSVGGIFTISELVYLLAGFVSKT